MRVGIGYDVHRIAPNRVLVLGGVRFDTDWGLEGHSDADVALHALCDALLGAAALGDIGQHFPPTDEQWRGADSLELLRRVGELIANRGFICGNADITIVAEKPKIGPRANEMRARIAGALKIDADTISVKATTNEQIGLIGRGEGIAAIAVATIMPR